MQAGAKVLGDDGYYQIDDSLQNYLLAEHGFASTDTNFANASFTTISKAGVTNPVLAVIGVNGAGVTVTSSTFNNGTFSWVVYGAGASPVQFEYFIFDKPQPQQSQSNYGLRIWQEDGDLAFDSSFKYMRVAGFTGLGASFTPASGRKYAVVFSGGVIQILRSGGTGNTGVSTTTGYFTTGPYTIQVYTGQFPPRTIEYTYSLLYIDVTDF